MRNEILIKEIVNNYTDSVGIGKVSIVLNAALSHSASVFSKFMSRKVDFKISGINESVDIPSQYSKLKVAISDLKGDLKGRSYLVFNQTDCESLYRACLSENLRQNVEMQDAILMELDNILTAAVVTNLSNTLKINCYAYIPALTSIDLTKLFEFIESDHRHDCLLITVKTSFTVDDLAMSPLFIWALELKLIDIITKS